MATGSNLPSGSNLLGTGLTATLRRRSGGGAAQGVVTGAARVNQIFVLQANAGALTDTMITQHAPSTAVGEIGAASHGQSRVIDPLGVVLEEARVFGEQLLIHDLDLTLLSDPKRRMPMGSLHSAVFGAMWREGMKTVGNRMKIEW